MYSERKSRWIKEIKWLLSIKDKRLNKYGGNKSYWNMLDKQTHGLIIVLRLFLVEKEKKKGSWVIHL